MVVFVQGFLEFRLTAWRVEIGYRYTSKDTTSRAEKESKDCGGVHRYSFLLFLVSTEIVNSITK